MRMWLGHAVAQNAAFPEGRNEQLHREQWKAAGKQPPLCPDQLEEGVNIPRGRVSDKRRMHEQPGRKTSSLLLLTFYCFCCC